MIHVIYCNQNDNKKKSSGSFAVVILEYDLSTLLNEGTGLTLYHHGMG